MKLQIGINGNTYEVEIEVIEDDEVPHHPFYGMSYPLVPATVHSVTGPVASDSDKTGDEDKFCRSPVSGIVNKVNVAPGQTIAENELIMVIEAMKMETNVTAPRSGIVKSVRVAAGDSAKVNQIVVELE